MTNTNITILTNNNINYVTAVTNRNQYSSIKTVITSYIYE